MVSDSCDDSDSSDKLRSSLARYPCSRIDFSVIFLDSGCEWPGVLIVDSSFRLFVAGRFSLSALLRNVSARSDFETTGALVKELVLDLLAAKALIGSSSIFSSWPRS